MDSWGVRLTWFDCNKTFKMSSPSDSSCCTSESDLESFTVDEVIGEFSEFAPYDDSCANSLLPRKKPRTTTKEFIAKKKRNNSFNEDIRERCQRMNGMVLSWNVDLYFYFPISTYPSLNRARDERDYVFCLSLQFRCYVISCSPDFMR